MSQVIRHKGGDIIVSLTTAQKVGIAVAVTVGIAVGILVAVQVAKIPATGRIVTLGVNVWTDATKTEKVASVDWGDISPNETKMFFCCIENTANVPTTLSIKTDNFNPALAEQYLIISWNIPQGTVLQPKQTYNTEIYLTVTNDAKDVTEFTHDIIILADAVK